MVRIRRFVLELAEHGQLVHQDVGDDSVATFLKQVGSIPARDEPFTIPASWAWVELQSISEKRLGKMLDRAKNKGTPRRYLRNVNVRWFDFDLSDVHEMPFEDSELDEFRLCKGDVMICEGGEPGRAAVWDEREPNIYFQKAIHRVRFPDGVDPKYFVNVLRSAADGRRLMASFTGVAIKHLTGKGLASFLVPLPPLVEQERIVAKVDELMALCDELEEAQKTRERRRDRLATASQRRLVEATGDEKAFHASADFYLKRVPDLTTRPEHIAELRRTILDLAVRARLVAQHSNDEPASVLLERIEGEKRDLGKAGQVRNRAPLAPVESSEAPYGLPPSWQWVRVRHVTSDRGQTVPDTAFTYIDVGSINKELGRVQNPAVLSPDAAPSRARKICRRGDVLYSCVRPYLLNVAVLDTDFTPAPIASTAFAVLNGFGLVLPEYLWTWLRSPIMVELVEKRMRGQAYPAINDSDFARLPLPLPPLKEQQRIVAKVDQLMTVCDDLEAQINEGRSTQARLLESVLHQALHSVA